MSVARPPPFLIPDNVTIEETMDEGLEVDGGEGTLQGIQCVNCGVWGSLRSSQFWSLLGARDILRGDMKRGWFDHRYAMISQC